MKDSVEGLRSEKVGEIIARCKAKAQASLGEVTEGLLEDMPPKVWGAIRSAIDTQKNLAKASIESQIKVVLPRPATAGLHHTLF